MYIKNRVKRWLAAILSVILCAGFLPFSAGAESCAENLASVAGSVVGKTYSDLGLPSSNWCVRFVGYCINNSSVKTLAGESISESYAANPMTLINWTCSKKAIGTYYSLSSVHTKRLNEKYSNLSMQSASVSSFQPQRGDIIVFDWDGREDANHYFSHAGVVTGTSGSNVTYVDGNSGSGSYTYVKSHTLQKSYSAIIGYIRISGQVNATTTPAQSEEIKVTPTNTSVSVSNGTYILESKLDANKVADVSSSSEANEANILLWTKNGGNNQKFKIEKNGDSYTISACHSGLAMDVSGGSTASGTNVWQYIANGTNAQKWTFEDAGNGYVYIRSQLGNYLDVYNGDTADGTNIWVYQFNGTDAQKWKLVPCAESIVSVQPGVYVLESKLDSNKVADIHNSSKESGAKLLLWTSNGGDNQKFKIEKEEGCYEISAYHSGLSLDVTNGSSASETYIQQYPFCGDNNIAQKWMFEDAGNGYVYIRSLLGTYLDVSGGNTADGTNIWAYQFNGTNAQKWKLVLADSKQETTTTTPTVTTPVASENKKVKFSRQTIYTQDQFTDVPANQWFTDNVANAVEFGLMKGSKDTVFNPYGDVTLAEAITMAARIHSIYTTGTENFVQTGKWYQVYLDYAYQNGIISSAYYNCDVTKKATRAQFAEIFAAALPSEALGAINTIADNAVPDVKTSASYGSAVYKLYRAGILTGGDATGAFSPATFITRAECATIVARMADSDNRVQFSL